MSTFFEKQLKKVLPCMLIMIISCCIFIINAGAETIIRTEEKKLFGSPTVSTSSMARSVDIDALADYLRAELIKCPESVDISSFKIPDTDENYMMLTDIIWYESPELFHIMSMGIGSSNGIYTTIYAMYEYSAQEYTQMYNACMTQANIILDGIADNSKLNDVQKALLIHDRLAVHCEYDISNYNNNTIPDESYTMYGALAEGVSVCQGYAEAYMYLLEKVGIENRLCSSDELNHAWNIVTINGKEYHVDVTWDDPTFDKTGYVRHTNFLRSSNGIYATGHDASDYDTSPKDTAYDSYFWQDSETAFQSIGNEIYYIDNEVGALKKYSNKSTMVELSVNTWPASTSGSYWIGNFSKLGSDGTNLYYNLSDAVYKYTISTGKTEKIWSPDLSAGSLFRIYGFMYKDGYLICDINDTPNFTLNDKKTYQQKYLYHNQSSSTLESISISSLPSKTEYYIGDSLNTEGLQLKLNYSNGLVKYATSGFTVSGFSSSSGGSKKVTVSYNGFTASFNVNVRTPGVTLDASSVKIELRDYCVLTATTDPKNISVKWSSSNNSVATVSGGLIEAVSVGTATVTAEFTYNGYTYKSTCNVTVECKHSSVQTIKGTAATCTENGLTDGKKCSACGTVTVAQQTINKKGHTEVTVNGKEATCTENGLTEGKKCSACGVTTVAQQTINKKGHTEVTVNGKDATCTENGLTEGKKCSVCGTVTVAQQTIAKKGHTEVAVNGKEATCTENGLTDGKKCSVCGTVITEQKTIAALGHKWKDATCTTAKTCTVCNATEGTAVGHKEITREENRKEASCKNNGSYDLVTYCSVCNTVIKTETKVIPATNDHVYATETERTASTCKTAGYVVMACGCGETKTETLGLDSDNHENIVVLKAVEPTCTESGLTEGKKCSACGVTTVAQQTINKKGHTEVTVNGKDATCTENGLTEGKKCSACGVTTVAQQTIAKKGHTEVIVNGKEATCTESGLTEGKKCSVCGAVTVAQQTIAKKGHKEVTIKGKDATCLETGLTDGKKCSVCDTVTVAQREIAKTKHREVTIKGKDATCLETGLTDGKKCSVCDTVTVAQREIAKAKHREVAIKGKDATCLETGLTDGKKCSVCDTVTVAQREIAKTKHREVTIKGKDATCAETGLTDGKKCSVCDTVTVAQKEIAKTRHREVTIKGKDATCAETGLTDGKKCSVCGTVTVEQREIAKKRHWTVRIPGKAPTETETGLTEGEKCRVCGTITKEQQIIPELNHQHDYTSTVTNPTCTEKGYTTYTCRCGDVYKDNYTDALGHKAEIIKGKDATCAEQGLTDGEKCTVCGEVTVSQEAIPAIGHTEKTVSGKEATCLETGLTDGKKCSVCDEILVQQEEIEKTGHLEVAIESKAPTCTENGSEAGTKCSVCNEIIVNPEKIEKLGHTHGEWETEKEPQVGEDGLMQQKCTVCGEVVDEKVIPALDDKPKNAFGDANNDGIITAADARLVLRMSARIDAYSDEQITYLDLTGDKKITAADARILLRISAKIESIESYIK